MAPDCPNLREVMSKNVVRKDFKCGEELAFGAWEPMSAMLFVLGNGNLET